MDAIAGIHDPTCISVWVYMGPVCPQLVYTILGPREVNNFPNLATAEFASSAHILQRPGANSRQLLPAAEASIRHLRFAAMGLTTRVSWWFVTHVPSSVLTMNLMNHSINIDRNQNHFFGAGRCQLHIALQWTPVNNHDLP